MMEGVSKFFIWDMEDLVMFHKKSLSKVGFHSFQPFKCLTTKANLPTLISNCIFPNMEGLEILKKIVPKRKSINEEVHYFQNTQQKYVQVVVPFEAKKKKKTLEEGCI
jgi:hypothetical protein